MKREQEQTERPWEMLPAVPENENLIQVMEENTRKMGEMILQLGTVVQAMQRRMNELEERQDAVTIQHADVKRLQAMIRTRAGELCGKYQLTDPESVKVIRAAIKKDLMKRFLVKDLHDLPARKLSTAEGLIDSWVNIRLMMERRGSA